MAFLINTVDKISSFSCGVSPIPFGSLFHVLHTTHFCIRILQRQALYFKYREEFAAANMFHFALGRRSIVHIAAQLVLVAKKITDCTEVQKLASRAARELIETITAVIPIPTRLIKNTLSARFEKSLPFIGACIEACPKCLIELAVRIDLVVKHAIILIQQLFTLSIALLEVFEAMVADDITDYESITGLFSNAKTVIQRLSEDVPQLLQGLDTNQKLIDRALAYFGADYSYCTLVTKTAESLGKVTEISGRVFNIMKDMLRDTAYVFGLHNTPKVFYNEGHTTTPSRKSNEICNPDAPCETTTRHVSGRFYTSY